MNTRTKSLISTIAGFVALGSFAMAIIYWAVFTNPPFNLNIGQWDAILRILMVVAIVAFSVYLIISPESVGATAGKRSTRLTANALVVCLVAIGIGIAINLIIANVAVGRADLTAGQDFTLSDQTIKVIQQLDARNKNVTAVAVYSDKQPSGTTRQSMEDLLKEYSSHSSHLRYEFLDPYDSPARARELAVQNLGTVVFDDGTKREYANTVSEADFTSALVRLLDTSPKTVAFLTGHGERSPDSSTQQQGYSMVKAALQRENYNVISWNTVTSPTIPISDVTVLVIAAPTKALNANETKAVQSYLDSGGHVLMALDPAMPAEALQPMTQILQKYGVTPVQGDLIDLASTASAQDPTIVLVRNTTDHDITRPLTRAGEALVFPLAMGLKPPTSTVDGFATTPLIQSSPSSDQSWLETELQNQAVKYDPGKDLPGPVTMGLVIAPATTTETSTNQVKTKLAVFSDADFASDIAVQQVIGNEDLFANSVSWLAGANELVSIRAKDPSQPRTITLDTGQKNFIGIATMLALPLFVLLFGAFTWWRRR